MAGQLLLPKCRGCGRKWFPPAPACPHYGAADHVLELASGRGRLYSWVVTHRALDPAFAEDLPYLIAAVDLEEGVRMIGRLFGVPPGAIREGAEVRSVLYEVSGAVLVGFEVVPA